MPNPILTAEQLEKANELLTSIRADLAALAGGDPDLLFAYRRKVAKMLTYDERSGPNERRKLKRVKTKEQNGLCPVCEKPLPPTYNVLDRFNAPDGYTVANTRLICEPCDRAIQQERGFR
ncbi:hypothetical protein BH10PLA2_BH10PLA2_00130 [soil metagenome]